MQCPVCKTELEVIGCKRYQTLDEHVCAPNRRPSKKRVFQCPNEACSAYKEDAEWIKTGEMFNTAESKHDFIDNESAPFGSWRRE